MFRKNISIVCALVLGFLTTPLFAEIVLIAPAENATVSTMSPLLRDFWAKDRAARLKILQDKRSRREIFDTSFSHGVPVEFSWKCTGGEKGPFTVTVSCDENLTATPHVWVADIKKNQLRGNAANFEVGRKYFWQVKGFDRNGKAVKSKTGTFVTAQDPVRIIIPWGGIYNMRDLGGKPGVDGRTIRQGMIFRSAGLNKNSPDYKSSREKYTPEKLKTMRPGSTRLTSQGRTYLAERLGIKTDLDLRNQGEVAGMTGSPLGDGVQWINVNFNPYEWCRTEYGKSAVARCFRVFCDRKNYPIVFHCIGGADRTGTLAVILGGVLGVDHEDLLRDFEITGHDNAPNERPRASLITGFDSYAPAEAAFAQKIEGYLHSCGITDQEIAEFREIMLLPKEK